MTDIEKLLGLVAKAQSVIPEVTRYTWLDAMTFSQAYVACVGAGPWKIGRRRTVQRRALEALGARDLTDPDVHIEFPLAWQNRFITNVRTYLSLSGTTMEDFCRGVLRRHVIYMASGCPGGSKVLSLFCRDKLRLVAFPIDRHVRRVLLEADLPADEQVMIHLCLRADLHVADTATLLVRYASGDVTGDLNPKDLLP